MSPTTGFPDADARDDFARARRRRALSELTRRLRGEPDDVSLILPFEEVVAALGRTGERDLGHQVVQLDTIVGSLERAADFDRAFRPRTQRVRGRWERIAAAMRRGEPLPPVDLVRVGEVHFVRDGHHRVSVARALGRRDIDANVVEVLTRVGAERTIRVTDLPIKGHERLFHERVPLPLDARARIQLRDRLQYPVLAETIEAWGFRAMQERQDYLDRPTVARLWYCEEYLPVVELIDRAKMIGPRETETEAYLRIGGERYMLLRTYEWSDAVLERLRAVR